ncbi:hypothetical protein T4A_5102 [Trichinella pseudospiralis]|uniref:Uncharacterized protein n=2 Tax=Trichinella pseudospiralis TaxID=6337 RepID=A0A0V1EJI5_TRIPS|nr:hypothetical protein T4A_5102 [Trichinella pseudospiralis]
MLRMKLSLVTGAYLLRKSTLGLCRNLLATSLAFRGLIDPSAMNQVLHTDWQAITLCFLERLTNFQRLFFQRSTNRPPLSRSSSAYFSGRFIRKDQVQAPFQMESAAYAKPSGYRNLTRDSIAIRKRSYEPE